MKIFLLIVSFVFGNIVSIAQNQLVNIINVKTNKIIKIKIGDRMIIKYHGYMNQLDFARDEVTGADDSCIYLGRKYDLVSEKLSERLQKNGRGYQHKIRFEDIIAFRRESVGRNLLRASVLGLPVAFGSYLLVSEYLKKNQSASAIEQFLIVTGIGIITLSLPKIVLPENLKYKVGNEWKFVMVNNFVP